MAPYDLKWADYDRTVAVRLQSEEYARRTTGGIVGSCTRNAVTGEVHLFDTEAHEQDFALVDLYSRQCLNGSPAQLAKDKYLFKPIPSPYRTWMYHYAFHRLELVSRLQGDLGVLEKVMRHRVNEGVGSCGWWSPIICYAPLALFTAMTCDYLLVFAALAVAVIIMLATEFANVPKYYKLCRPATLPFRVALLGVLVAYPNVAELLRQGPLHAAGYVFSLATWLVDFVLGDIRQLLSVSRSSSYQVVKELPNRVFVCRRVGNDFTQTRSADKDHMIDELIHGIANWTDDLKLVAEIRGFIVELVPMHHEDWESVWFNFQDTDMPVTFLGLDVFDDQCPTMREIEAEMEGLEVFKAEVAKARLRAQQSGISAAPSAKTKPKKRKNGPGEPRKEDDEGAAYDSKGDDSGSDDGRLLE